MARFGAPHTGQAPNVDLAFEPGPAVDLVSVVPRTLRGHLPTCARVVDARTAHVVCELATRTGPGRDPGDTERRLDALVHEAHHRVGCDHEHTVDQ